MLNMIAIRIPWSRYISWTTPVLALCSLPDSLYQFNPKHAYLMGAENDLRRNAIILYLGHPEFPETDIGCSCLEFRCEEVEARFPWLFHDTDPLLYRKY